MRILFGFLFLCFMCSTTYANQAEETLANASQWIKDTLPEWVAYNPNDELVLRGDSCRIDLGFKTMNTTHPANKKPEVRVRTFDADAFEVRSSSFYFYGGSLDHCAMTTHGQTSLSLKCEWQECETQGCAMETAAFSIERSGLSYTFKVSGQTCTWDAAQPDPS